MGGQPTAELSEETTAADPALTAEANGATADATTTPAEAITPELFQEAPVVVDINLSDRSWLSVTADGETVFEGTPEEGFEETWTAEDTLVLTTGNAGGVELSINGDEAVSIGDTGEVRTLTITPDSDADGVLAP
jgi:hypothetical protein